MPFKTVQTIEGSVPILTIIPTFWESKGILRWPPKNNMNLIKLIKDENSRPGAGWVTLQCSLKRNNIRTYEEANKELNIMEQNTDTENESYSSSFPVTSQQRNVNDFEKMAENLIHLQPGATDVPETSTQQIGFEQQNTIQVVQEEAIVQIVSSDHSDTMISNQTLILNKLNLIIDNQKRFAQKLASLSVQLEETNKNITKLQQEQQCNVTLLKDASQEEKESFSLKPIETSEEFEMFELTLADKTQRKKIMKFLSTLFLTKPGEGQTCAYKLMDILFTKEFLCQCSWSGGSKGENSKIPMKNFKNFRKFFFELVYMWDPSFTDDQMLNFLKIILRNATKRKAMQGIRESAKRVRKSKKSSKQVNNKANVPEDNYDCGNNQIGVTNNNDTGELRTEEESRAEVDNNGEPGAEDDNDVEPTV